MKMLDKIFVMFDLKNLHIIYKWNRNITSLYAVRTFRFCMQNICEKLKGYKENSRKQLKYSL